MECADNRIASYQSVRELKQGAHGRLTDFSKTDLSNAKVPSFDELSLVGRPGRPPAGPDCGAGRPKTICQTPELGIFP